MKLLGREMKIPDSWQLQARIQTVQERGIKLFNELLQEWLPYPASAERRPAPDFVIYRSSEPLSVPESIKNISSTGVYLCTRQRWPPGTIVPLTLQRQGPLEDNSERRVTLNARVVWWGQDGVGMAFSLPLDLNLDLWQSAMTGAEEIGDPGDILAPFRLAEALAFLGRICPSAVQELRQLVCRELGKTRAANAVELALEAELLLAAEPNASRMIADPGVIRRIVEDGSWADEDWIRHLWAGLLTSYCGTGQTPESDIDLVERFSQLAPVHLCIFKAACKRATKIVSDSREVFAKPLIFTFSEIQNMTGTANLEKIQRDLHHLAGTGLIENLPRSQSLIPARDEAFVTPSRLGFALYARCHGHRSAPESFYGLAGLPGASQANA